MKPFALALVGLAAGCLATKDRPEFYPDCSPYVWDDLFEECSTECYDDTDCDIGYFCCDFDAYYYEGSCYESQEYTCLPV